MKTQSIPSNISKITGDPSWAASGDYVLSNINKLTWKPFFFPFKDFWIWTIKFECLWAGGVTDTVVNVIAAEESSACSAEFPSATPGPKWENSVSPAHAESPTHLCLFIHAIHSRPLQMGCCSPSLCLLNFYLSSLFVPVSQKSCSLSIPLRVHYSKTAH